MKKLIIVGFFTLFGLLSYVIVKAAIFIKMDKVDIIYVQSEHSLSDNEIEHYNKVHYFDKQIETDHKYDETIIWKLRVTRTKKIFGWSTKTDTIKVSEESREFHN